MLRRLVSKKGSIVTTIGVLIGGIGVVAAMAAFGPSEPSRSDIAASKAYVHARYALEQASQAELPVTRAALDGVVAHIGATCPGILRGAPLDRPRHRGRPGSVALETPARDLLALEAYKGLETTLIRSQATSRREFVDAVDHLRWTDRKVTSLVHSIVDTEAGWLNGPLPDTCHDMKAWVASGYRRLTASTRRVPFGIQPISERVSNELIALGYRTRFPSRDLLQLLKRYQHSGEHFMNDRVEQLEVKMASTELQLLPEAMARIESALGLPRCRSSLLAHRHRARPNGSSLASGCR
jgi:hypothetical protein